MEALSANQVRELYLSWFEERGHHRYPSDSLVPSNDPTLLFTGAGMNQFKDMFIGKGNLPWTRVTTSQKCMRVPDLEKVGRTPRHHTFFEMLGNFSFGDYFKRECIPWVFGYFTEAVGIPREHLVVSVYEDDDEAFEIWRETADVPPERIYRFGEKENFWPAEAPTKGPNGPCGPCSEIFYDFRPDEPLPLDDGLESLPDDRFTEIGNCVFTQFNRLDGGKLEPLPQKNIDVGLGLERIVAVVQATETNFGTDLFRPYIDYVCALRSKHGPKTVYGQDPEVDTRLRRIADHIRAVTFCIADGVIPSNEGRGYVVRKILRRACRDGYALGLEEPFLHGLSSVVSEVMGEAYPELITAQGQVKSLIRQEEDGFRQIYTQGIQRLQTWVESLTGAETWPKAMVEEAGELPVPPGSGDVAFELHDTFGFPVDITRVLLRDRGFALDEDGFEAQMQAQKDRARASSAISGEVFVEGAVTRLKEQKTPATTFVGYEHDEGRAKVLAIVRGDELVESIGPVSGGAGPVSAELIVDRTPFYAESGGQVGDRGELKGASARGRISDCQKREGYSFHLLELTEGQLRVGDEVELVIDAVARRETERHHTATHLLHQALKDVLGSHVSQAGSLVAPDRLRFDFTHSKALTDDQIKRVEDIVNREILKATPVEPRHMALTEARKAGFVAMFGEKYGDEVRTLSVGHFSRELCGGTHVANTGNIGSFRIVTETSVAAGVRRIEALVGFAALAAGRADSETLDGLARSLKTPKSEIENRIAGLHQRIRTLEKDLETARSQGAEDALAQLEAEIRTRETSAGNAAVLAAHVDGLDQKGLLELCDRLRKKHPSFAGILIGSGAGGLPLVATVTANLVGAGFDAGKLLSTVARTLGGGGGGRAEMARGKGSKPEAVPEALAAAWQILDGE